MAEDAAVVACRGSRCAGSKLAGASLEALRQHGDGVVAKLVGIDDRDASEALGSCYIGAPRDALPPPAQDEYYWADLIGLAV
jgi:16S rRNA processing protein RimM